MLCGWIGIGGEYFFGNVSYLDNNSIHIVEYFFVLEANDGDICAGDVFVALVVVFLCAMLHVVHAVEFDCEANCRGVEVEDVAAYAVLSPETYAEYSLVAQTRPENSLFGGQVVSKLAAALLHRSAVVDACHIPSVISLRSLTPPLS